MLTPSSHPLSAFSLPAPSCGRCCLVCVAMAPCGHFAASRAASCVLFTEGSWQDWGSVTQNRRSMTAAVWTGAQDSTALSVTHEVTVALPTLRRGTVADLTASDFLVFLLVFGSLWPTLFLFIIYFFFTCRLAFTRNHFFGNETGVFPHIMHINGYQWLSV